MTASAFEAAFQRDILRELVEGGWVMGTASDYDRTRALYAEDCLAFVKKTQPKVWQKYQGLYPTDPEKAFLDKLTSQLNKADPQASAKHLRLFGTLGVLRHGLRDKSCTFKLCQFKPDHGLNPETLAAYEANILRVVPELTYSPYATPEHLAETGTQAKAWRLDLVLFVNGIPVATLELKSEFKQAVRAAIEQYRKTRLPKDPETNKPEPLLTFKRGALVHFAVSQYEAYMATRLDGENTRFLPFNRGTANGGSGNDTLEDQTRYATDYLWREVLAPDNLLNIIGRFIHLEIKEKEDWEGRKYKQETLIFPRYHQWDLVRTLIGATRREGPGHKYLAQHSAGSGKSNSIAWTAHQLASLYDDDGEKVFHSVIVVTDRNVLDSQLQDTIYQFEHADGVVGRINREEGQGSKSEKLAAALESSTPIVIVTIQTFPHVLKAIEDSVSLRERRYAIIADEAHSSQTGRTASEMKAVLSKEAADGEGEDLAVSAEDMLAASVEARRASQNLSYYAFTATPKSKTLELFGRLPNPNEPPSKTNKPLPFHVYSMRQAIEEGYILDVLRNYTSYKVAWQLAQKTTLLDSWRNLRDPGMQRSCAGWLHSAAIAANLLDLDAALQLSEELLSLDPHNDEFLLAAAAAAANARKLERAAELLDSISNNAPRKCALRGVVFALLGQPEQAIGSWRQALESDEISPSLRSDVERDLVLALIDAGSLDEARCHSERLLTNHAGKLKPLLTAFAVALRLQDDSLAGQLLDSARSVPASAGEEALQLQLGDALAQFGRFEHAAEVYGRVTEELGGERCTNRRIQCLHKAGLLDQALRLSTEAVSRTGPSQFHIELQCMVHGRLGAPSTVEHLCRGYPQNHPNDAVIKLRLAMALVRMGATGAYEEAASLIDVESLAKTPTHVQFGVLILIRVHRPELALELLYRARYQYRESEDAHSQYFCNYVQLSHSGFRPEVVDRDCAACLFGSAPSRRNRTSSVTNLNKKCETVSRSAHWSRQSTHWVGLPSVKSPTRYREAPLRHSDSPSVLSWA